MKILLFILPASANLGSQHQSPVMLAMLDVPELHSSNTDGQVKGGNGKLLLNRTEDSSFAEKGGNENGPCPATRGFQVSEVCRSWHSIKFPQCGGSGQTDEPKPV